MVNQLARHIPEFDALRALAALGVMVAHFAPCEGVPVLSRVEHRLGALGVDMFFALSGFLITGILMRRPGPGEGQTVWITLRQFYARRFLRIFPLYYLVVGLFVLVLAPGLREHLVWFLTYTVNIGKALGLPNWRPLNHFWTLAVEEQFYIAWPLIVLLCTRKTLLRICGASVALSLLSRVALAAVGANSAAIVQSTLCCLEPLTLGAVFAILDPRRPSTLRFASYSLVGGGVASAVLYLLAPTALMEIFARTAFGFFFAALIFLVSVRSGASSLRLLRLPSLTYLGAISYGLYVWHLPILYLTGGDPVSAWAPRGAAGIFNFLVLVGLTIAVSSVSWHVFEKPLNQLKRHFPYQVADRAAGRAAPPVAEVEGSSASLAEAPPAHRRAA